MTADGRNPHHAARAANTAAAAKTKTDNIRFILPISEYTAKQERRRHSGKRNAPFRQKRRAIPAKAGISFPPLSHSCPPSHSCEGRNLRRRIAASNCTFVRLRRGDSGFRRNGGAFNISINNTPFRRKPESLPPEKKYYKSIRHSAEIALSPLRAFHSAAAAKPPPS